jgi:signal transduction histidine kinase/ActR/RegA family two-component response regulator
VLVPLEGGNIRISKTDKYSLWYFFALSSFGITVSCLIYQFTAKIERDTYLSEVKVEASSLAMSLDLIMANHAIKLQSFEDHIDLRRMRGRTNKAVIQAAFDHSIFSSFSFLKYKGISKKTGEVVVERLLRIVSSDRPATPTHPETSHIHSQISQQAIREMVLKNEKQRQLLVDINGEVLYVIISRSSENDKIFFGFSGFAKNLFKDNFPSKTNLEGIIHQAADNTRWHVLKEGKEISFKKVDGNNVAGLMQDKVILQYMPRFSSGKYFTLQVLVAKNPPFQTLFSVVILVAGIVITILIASLLYYLINRNIRVNKLVKERTRELEAESKKSKEAAIAKSRFLANISHEIRTPLNIVLGMIDLINETSLSSIQQHYVDSINNSGKHLLNLINDILDMTRVDVSDVAFKLEKVSILQLMEESCLAVDELARNKNIDLYMDLDITLPNEIEVDPSRIRQILINLLTNAVKYTEKGFVEFSVFGRMDRESGDYSLEFRIKDSGVGISEADKEAIFKAFYQVNSTVQRSQGGVGLGLSIVATIVKRMGGKVDVYSTLGIGSTFVVSLPIANYSKETWSSVKANKNASQLENILISNDSILTGIFSKYMKVLKSPLGVFNQINKIPSDIEKFNCIFIDLDTVVGFQKNLLDNFKYKKLICIGEPSESPDIFSEKQNQEMVLWPNKLLLPSSISEFVLNDDVREEKNIKIEPAVQPLKVKNKKDINILIVDDDVSNKILFEAYCAKQGWNVNFASNGQEAIENHLRRQHFDILVTDLQMPIMDGFTLIQELNDDEKQLHKPDYTIVLSADSTEETINMSKKLNVDTFLAKPIRKAEFLSAIDVGLNKLETTH